MSQKEKLLLFCDLRMKNFFVMPLDEKKFNGQNAQVNLANKFCHENHIGQGLRVGFFLYLLVIATGLSLLTFLWVSLLANVQVPAIFTARCEYSQKP